MKKKILMAIFIIAILASGLLVGKFLFSDGQIFKKGINKNKDMLSMMLETDSGSGEYILETRSSWPTQSEGFIFNSELSKCERGSKVSWNEETNEVLMTGNSSDKCYVYFDKYQSITINSSSATVSGNSIVITIDATAGDGEIFKYYYSKDDGLSYNESTSGTFTFSNLDSGTYNIKYYVLDSNGMSSEVISKEVSITSITLASYVKSLYTGTQGDNNLYYHDSTLENGAGDKSYRYAGSSDTTNNFVCFGSDEATCPDDNLYRIIGVFGDQVKLIKYNSATSALLGTDGDYSSGALYYWNKNKKNTWSESSLNTINLNKNYVTNIGTKWEDKIAETNWIVGGNSYSKISTQTVVNAYKNEIISPATAITFSAKIGLMYVSDYGYATIPSSWTTILTSYSDSEITSQNWMYKGTKEWTITPHVSNNKDEAYDLNYRGFVVDYGSKVGESPSEVRPCFYLNSDVVKVGNQQGTKNDPYRIN